MAASTPSNPSSTPPEGAAARALAFVDGALGAAGHAVDDPETRDLLRQQAAGEISTEDAIAEFRRREGLG